MRPSDSRDALDLVAHLLHLDGCGAGGGLADAGGRPVLAERVAQRLRPLAGGDAGAGGGDRRRHDVLVVVGGDAGQLGERASAPAGSRSARHALERLALVGLDARVDHEDPAVLAAGSGDGSVSV